MEKSFKSWLEDLVVANHKALPVVANWGLWLARNANIFNKHIFTPQQVYYKLQFAYEDCQTWDKIKPLR